MYFYLILFCLFFSESENSNILWKGWANRKSEKNWDWVKSFFASVASILTGVLTILSHKKKTHL